MRSRKLFALACMGIMALTGITAWADCVYDITQRNGQPVRSQLVRQGVVDATHTALDCSMAYQRCQIDLSFLNQRERLFDIDCTPARTPEVPQMRIYSAFCTGDCNQSQFNSQVQNLVDRSNRGVMLNVNQDGRGNTYEIILDLGQIRNVDMIALRGHSTGYWCEGDFKSPEAQAGWCHNDNNIGISVSSNARNFINLTSVQQCGELDTGCSFAGGFGARYVKISSSSSCQGCINNDLIQGIDIR